VAQQGTANIRPYFNIDTTDPIKPFNRHVQPDTSSSLIGIYYSSIRSIQEEILRSAHTTAKKHTCCSNTTEFTVDQRVLLRSRPARHWPCREMHRHFTTFFMPFCTTDYQQPIIQRNPNKEIIQRDAAIGIIQRNPYNEIIQKDPVRDEAASPRIPTNIVTPVVQQVAGGTSGVLRLADNQHQQHSSIPTPYPSSVSSDAMETIFAHPADRDKDNPQQQILHLD